MSDEEQKRPRLTVVAEGNPEKARHDRAREYATDTLSWATREFTANLMRILAGAGKSYELLNQINKLVDAINVWIKLGGHAMSVNFVLEQVLQEAAESDSDRLQERMYSPAAENQMASEDRYDFYDRGSFDIEGGKDNIVQGALRVMASRIVGQDRQEQNAENLMFKGIERLRRGQGQAAKYYSSPTLMAQRKRERERQRTEIADRQRERMETAKPRERQQRQVEIKRRVRGTERLERRIEPAKKIGIYDALEEQRTRAGKPKADPKTPK